MFIWLYKMFLTFNSTSLILVVFFINKQYFLCCLNDYQRWIAYSVIFFIPVLLTYISLLITKFLSSDNIEGEIKDIESGHNSFLPSYLAYFFVALSIGNVETLFFIYVILFIFTFFSQTLYFNPIFLILGYQFYNITTGKNVKIFLISKKEMRNCENVTFSQLKRINDFTYIDVGDKK